MSSYRPIAVTAVLAALLLAGCGTDEAQAPATGPTGTAAATPNATATTSTDAVPEGVAA